MPTLDWSECEAAEPVCQAGHTVRTAYQGYSAKFKAAELAGLGLFVTTDKNMNYQQNLSFRNRTYRYSPC